MSSQSESEILSETGLEPRSELMSEAEVELGWRNDQVSRRRLRGLGSQPQRLRRSTVPWVDVLGIPHFRTCRAALLLGLESSPGYCKSGLRSGNGPSCRGYLNSISDWGTSMYHTRYI